MPHFNTTNQTISDIILFGRSINPLCLVVFFAVNDKMASSKMCTGSENYQLRLTIAEYEGVPFVFKEGITIHNDLIQKQYND